MDRNIVVGFHGRAIAASLFLAVVTLCLVAAPDVARSDESKASAAQAPAASNSSTSSANVPLSAIEALTDENGAPLTDKNGKLISTVGLNDYLGVKINVNGPIDPRDYVLFLNGHESAGLDDTAFDNDLRLLIFHLRRNSANADAWAALLGSPCCSWSKNVAVSLGKKLQESEIKNEQPNETSHPSIVGVNGNEPKFLLEIMSPLSLAIAVFAVGIIGGALWGGATRSTILKDNLLPQIAPKRQPYSLGRWQMAFWFVLIFASFIFLYLLLWDPNTVSDQALMLMGISGATGLAAIAVDAAKDTPVGAANTALRALGLFSYADVERVQQEIADRRQQLVANPRPVPATATKIQAEITDRQLLLRTYENAIKPFVSQGLRQDLLTDINGTALHRLQVFCWTLVLGVVFIIGVYRNLAMPQFSTTLLALMAVSGAGYVGFKYPEKQN